MNPTFTKVHSEIARAMRLSRCRKCGCMKGTLENLKASLPTLKIKDSRELLRSVDEWYERLEPLAYPCFGCKFCIPPEAMTVLTKKYPSLAASTLSTCEMKVSADSWPQAEGEYTVVDKDAPVAVSTLASTTLEGKLVKLRPEGLCIIGKTETENIGIDKIVKNTVSNPAIRHLIVAGKDPEGHRSGETLVALWKNGVDSTMRVIGSHGRRPILKNVSQSEVDAFRKQIQVDDMTGTENTRSIARKIRELAASAVAECAPSCGCHDTQPVKIAQPVVIPLTLHASSGGGCGTTCDDTMPVSPGKEASIVERLIVKGNAKSVKLDKAGYFVILPDRKKKNILVEHYSYENKLLRKIEGKKSRDIYMEIIRNKWVTELTHAAYLGKELAQAELSIRKGFKFVQDGA